MTKKQIKVEVARFEGYDLDGSLMDAIYMLNEILDKVPDEHKDICEIDVELDSFCAINIYYHRPEIDEEEGARLVKEEEQAEISIADKRAKLEQLKRELGDD